jgi:hypothetical protein
MTHNPHLPELLLCMHLDSFLCTLYTQLINKSRGGMTKSSYHQFPIETNPMDIAYANQILISSLYHAENTRQTRKVSAPEKGGPLRTQIPAELLTYTVKQIR